MNNLLKYRIKIQVGFWCLTLIIVCLFVTGFMLNSQSKTNTNQDKKIKLVQNIMFYSSAGLLFPWIILGFLNQRAQHLFNKQNVQVLPTICPT
jgi:hypothetical protein